MDLDGLLRPVLRPVVVNLVLDELVDVEWVPEVDEAVSFAGLLVLYLVHWDLDDVKLVLMVSFEILANIYFRVLAGNILDHEICPTLLPREYLIRVDWASVVLALVRVD